MKFFLDTANLNEIREGASLGIADGVTTNPSLIAKEGGVDFKQHIAAICEIVQGPVSAEVTSQDKDEWFVKDWSTRNRAQRCSQCPLTREGLKATRSSQIRDQSQCHVMFLSSASDCCREGWRIFYQPVFGSPGRHW